MTNTVRIISYGMLVVISIILFCVVTSSPPSRADFWVMIDTEKGLKRLTKNQLHDLLNRVKSTLINSSNVISSENCSVIENNVDVVIEDIEEWTHGEHFESTLKAADLQRENDIEQENSSLEKNILSSLDLMISSKSDDKAPVEDELDPNTWKSNAVKARRKVNDLVNKLNILQYELDNSPVIPKKTLVMVNVERLLGNLNRENQSIQMDELINKPVVLESDLDESSYRHRKTIPFVGGVNRLMLDQDKTMLRDKMPTFQSNNSRIQVPSVSKYRFNSIQS